MLGGEVAVKQQKIFPNIREEKPPRVLNHKQQKTYIAGLAEKEGFEALES